MGTIAYELRESHAGTVEQLEHADADPVEVPLFTGGLIRVGVDGEADVAELLEEGGGTIVVDEVNEALIAALDEYPALKRVSAGGAAPTASTSAYADSNVTALRADAKARELEGGSSATKDELVNALEEHDRRLADGTLDELGAPLTVAGLAAAANNGTEGA